MKKAAEYRAQARKYLFGRYGNIVLARLLGFLMIFVTAIVMVVMATYTLTYIMAASVSRFGGGIPFGVVLMSIIIALLMVIMMVTEVLLQGGTLKMAYKAFRGQDIRLGDMFYGFKGKTPWHILGISFVIGLIQVIFMIPYFVCYMRVNLELDTTATGIALVVLSWLLFIVVSIVLSLFWGLALYVMIDCPDLGTFACLKASAKLTKRRRWKLFCFHLSFIGWHILGQLSFGIGTLWIMPYIECSTFGFYQDLKAEKERLGIKWRPDPAGKNPAGAS